MCPGKRENSSAESECSDVTARTRAMSRRSFLGGVGGVAALGQVTALIPPVAAGRSTEPLMPTSLPPGATLRVKPLLLYAIPIRQEQTSWRWYGGIQTLDDVNKEADRLQKDLQELASHSDFPVEFLPLEKVNDVESAKQIAAHATCDVLLMFGACGYADEVPHAIAAAGKPSVLFLRHRTQPHYCQHVSTHAIFLRRWTDSFQEPNMDVHDVAIDDYDEILWRLRALYGLKNAKGTKMLAIGGVMHYCPEGTKHGEQHATDVWGYEIETIELDEFARRLREARGNTQVMRDVAGQAEQLLAEPDVTLNTERQSVVDSFLALRVCKDLLREKGAANFGFGPCMGRPVIGLLGTPPCLVLALANDEGYTAYCHTDLTHTVPGVLMRWISGRPSFVCNSHFPHDGVYTVAHCAAPRKMNGRDCEPVTIMTHYESDCGAATKVAYTIGQTVTVIVPAVNCSQWQGFRGKIIEAPSRPACRSQMDIQIEGNWQRLVTDQVGFHVIVTYGDYLREVGYALKKVQKIAWDNLS